MARHAVRGVLAPEGIQTGDGRFIVPGGFEWADLPLPFHAMLDWSLHVDLTTSAPQVGLIETAARNEDGTIGWTGFVEDEMDPVATELIRRLETGGASHGAQQQISVDPDNWELQIVWNGPAEDTVEVVILAASGCAPAGQTLSTFRPSAALVAAGIVVRPVEELEQEPVVAAAGDGDPLENPAAEIWFEDGADWIIERYTRLRIRGATAVSAGAFTGAYVELDPEAPAPADPGTAPVVAAGAPALIRGLIGRDDPPAELFEFREEEVDGSLNIDDEWSHGWLALWDTCHTGYTDRCVPPPREEEFSLFHHGAVVTEEGERVPVGNFTWGIPHADLNLDQIAAQEHYANSRFSFGRAVLYATPVGIWHTGCLRSGITRGDVRDLQALSMSGDWRYDIRTGRLRAIAALAVNYPGFPVPRLAARSMAAAAAVQVEANPAVRYDGHRVMALTAAGMVRPAGTVEDDCGCGGQPAGLSNLERVTLGRLGQVLPYLERQAREDTRSRLASR